MSLPALCSLVMVSSATWEPHRFITRNPIPPLYLDLDRPECGLPIDVEAVGLDPTETLVVNISFLHPSLGENDIMRGASPRGVNILRSRLLCSAGLASVADMYVLITQQIVALNGTILAAQAHRFFIPPLVVPGSVVCGVKYPVRDYAPMHPKYRTMAARLAIAVPTSDFAIWSGSKVELDQQVRSVTGARSRAPATTVALLCM
jgi:hypothetical protein